MPTYDYQCDMNGRVVEVRHKMADVISNWGELTQLAGIPAGDTPLNTPVRKLANGGQVVNSQSLGNKGEPACASGGCSGGSCQFN